MARCIGASNELVVLGVGLFGINYRFNNDQGSASRQLVADIEMAQMQLQTLQAESSQQLLEEGTLLREDRVALLAKNWASVYGYVHTYGEVTWQIIV